MKVIKGENTIIPKFKIGDKVQVLHANVNVILEQFRYRYVFTISGIEALETSVGVSFCYLGHEHVNKYREDNLELAN